MRTSRINRFLKMASSEVKSGLFEEAERTYRDALALSMEHHGADNAVTGLILLELMDLFERCGRVKEAEQIWGRIRKIIIGYLGKPSEA